MTGFYNLYIRSLGWAITDIQEALAYKANLPVPSLGDCCYKQEQNLFVEQYKRGCIKKQDSEPKSLSDM